MELLVLLVAFFGFAILSFLIFDLFFRYTGKKGFLSENSEDYVHDNSKKVIGFERSYNGDLIN